MGGTNEPSSTSDLEAPSPPGKFSRTGSKLVSDNNSVANRVTDTVLVPGKQKKRGTVGGDEKTLFQGYSTSLFQKLDDTPGTSPVPGAVAVQANSKAISLDMMAGYDSEEEQHTNSPNDQDKASSFIVSARLVEDEDVNYSNGCPPEKHESRIPGVIAEVVQTEEHKVCGMTICVCRVVVFIVCLFLVGAVAATVVAFLMKEGNAEPTVLHRTISPSAAPSHILTPAEIALLQELETWIIGTDQDRLPFQDPSSAQARALNWLSMDEVAQSDDRTTMAILERYTLAVFYYSTDGPHWTSQDLNFLTGKNVCEWNYNVTPQGHRSGGIYCDETSSIRQIRLNSTGLAGTLPTELGKITTLQHFDVDSNLLKGTIPTQFGLWTDLKILWLGVNGLTGTLPTELSQLTAADVLYFSSNLLTGTLPTELAQMTSVIEFHVDDNLLNGTCHRSMFEWR
jgi:hypothetical protein